MLWPLPLAPADKVAAQTVPRVTRMIFLFGAESNNTYELEEELRVRARWSNRVVMTGAPQLGSQIGSQTRYATLVENSVDIAGTDFDFMELL